MSESTTRTRASARPTHTVNRPHRKSTSDVEQRAETLADFSAVLRAYSISSGRSAPVSFMSDVIELAQTRVAIKMLKERRALIFEQLKHRYASGTTITSTGEFELRMSRAPEPVTMRTVDSEAVKRTYPKTWQLSRIVVPRVAVTAPKTFALEIPVPRLPAVPRGVDNLDRCVAAYKHRAFDRFESLRRDEAVLIARLDTIADEFDWDGLPLSFSDGWRVGLRCLRFDADRLTEIAPDVFDELAVEKTRTGSTRLYLARPGEDDERHELDGE